MIFPGRWVMLAALAMGLVVEGRAEAGFSSDVMWTLPGGSGSFLGVSGGATSSATSGSTIVNGFQLSGMAMGSLDSSRLMGVYASSVYVGPSTGTPPPMPYPNLYGITNYSDSINLMGNTPPTSVKLTYEVTGSFTGLANGSAEVTLALAVGSFGTYASSAEANLGSASGFNGGYTFGTSDGNPADPVSFTGFVTFNVPLINGSSPFALQGTAEASGGLSGPFISGFATTVELVSVTLPDGNSPASEGYTLSFGSGLVAPGAAVPEPSSLTLCGIAGLTGLGVAWKRWKRAA
jgi:hypothetical protein